MIPETLPNDASELVELTPRAVAHLRAQLHRKRLGLVFGSGASKDLRFPDWDSLVRKIAGHQHVGAQHLLKKFIASSKENKAASQPNRSLASITQMLFGTYRAKTIKRKKLTEPLSFLQEQQIRTDWMKIIHKALYEKVPASGLHPVSLTPA
jgi:hypothetical protein